MTLLPTIIESTNYILRNATNENVEEIQEILDSCSYINKWDPPNSIFIGNAGYRIMRSNDSNKDNKEAIDLKVIIRKETNTIAGIIECCYGYPEKGYFCISDLEIKKELQHQGIGQEVVQCVIKEVKIMNEYNHLFVCVGLMNWPSLRFWSQVGFSRIINILGDKEYSSSSYSSIVLEMQ